MQKFYLRPEEGADSPNYPDNSVTMPLGSNNTLMATGSADRSQTLGPKSSGPQAATSWNALAQTAQQSGLIGRWSSSPLAAQTIASGTWTMAWASSEGNANANSFMRVVVYIWRPRTQAIVGTRIYDAVADIGTEWATSEQGRVATFSGGEVIVEDGDVLVLECWHRATQGMANAYANSFWDNGTTDPVDGTATTDAASYLLAPANISLFAEPYRVVFGCEFGDKGETEADVVLAGKTWGIDLLQDTTITRTGRFAMKVIPDSAGTLRWDFYNLPAAFMHFAARFSSKSNFGADPGASISKIQLSGEAANQGGALFLVSIDSDGNPGIVRDAGTPSRVAVGTTVLNIDTWYVFQLDVPSYGASVTVTLRVYNNAGTLLETIAATAQDTTGVAAALGNIELGLPIGFAGTTMHYDDLVVHSNAAPDPSVRVYPLNPDANGGFIAWTGAFGDVDDMIDQTGPDVLTDQISSATLNQKESFGLENLAAGSTVQAVMTLARSLNAGEEGNSRMFLYDGTNERYGGKTIYGLPSAVFKTSRGAFTLMPDGSAWTLTGLNALQLGVRAMDITSEQRVRCLLVLAVAKPASAGQTFTEAVQAGPIVVAVSALARLTALDKPSLTAVLTPSVSALLSAFERQGVTALILPQAVDSRAFSEVVSQAITILTASSSRLLGVDGPPVALVILPAAQDNAAFQETRSATIILTPSVVSTATFRDLPAVTAQIIVTELDRAVLTDKDSLTIIILPSVTDFVTAEGGIHDETGRLVTMQIITTAFNQLIAQDRVGITVPFIVGGTDAKFFSELSSTAIQVAISERDRAIFAGFVSEVLSVSPTVSDRAVLTDRLTASLQIVADGEDVRSMAETGSAVIVLSPEAVARGVLSEKAQQVISILTQGRDTARLVDAGGQTLVIIPSVIENIGGPNQTENVQVVFTIVTGVGEVFWPIRFTAGGTRHEPARPRGHRGLSRRGHGVTRPRGSSKSIN